MYIIIIFIFESFHITGGSRLSRIFWEHKNLSGLSIIRLIYIKLYRKKETKFWRKKIRAKRESGLTAVRLKWDPPVPCMVFNNDVHELL